MTQPDLPLAELPPGVVALIPMRNLVLFPHVLAPVSVGRAKSIAALEYAIANNAALGIVLQKDPKQDDPAIADLHAIGTLAEVVHHLKPQASLHHAVCQGTQRFRVGDLVAGYPFLAAKVAVVE
jgi:ATP-dependent Lon protease